MWNKLPIIVGICMLCAATIVPAAAQEGAAQKLGEKIDKALNKVTRELKQEWGEIRQSIERMSVQGRVYSRLRWDKNVDITTIDVESIDNNVIVLKGSVATAAAKRKAVQLTNDTVGVVEVVDKLIIKAASE